MEPTTSEIILSELRELRADFDDFTRRYIEKVAKLEADNHAVMGNSNPGRLKIVEDDVDKLKTWRRYAIGYIGGCTAVLSAIIAGAAWLISEVAK